MKPWALIVSAVLVTASAGTVHAHAGHKAAVPNALTNNCLTCHLPGLDYERNPFGLAIEPLALALTPMEDWWPAVRDLDSDADGQTNAQELGDPCLTFAMGSTPDRTTNISNPGVLESVSADPDSCADPAVDPGEGEGEGEEPATPEEPVDPGNDGGETTGDSEDGAVWQDPQWQTPAPKQRGCSAGSGDDSSQIGWWLLAVGLVLVTRALRGGDDDGEEEETL